MTLPKRLRGRTAQAPDTLAREPRQQAADHRHTRAARGKALAEDYVEVIADLIDADGEARVVDVARRLGVSHVTVTKTVERLQREGLVSTRPYRSIFLTDAGRDLAEHVRRRHHIVLQFLLSIGVDDRTAHEDAEGIEHHVSNTTLRAFERLTAERRANPAD